MSEQAAERLRFSFSLLLSMFYAAAGVLHLVAPNSFLRIVPPGIPLPSVIVAATGVCEIVGALGLLAPRTRRLAGRMLALYALCVWPANIYHAFWRIDVPPAPDSWWYHGPRLAFQPLLIWAALLVGGRLPRAR